MLDLLLILLVEEPPEPSEVKAGPLAFLVWIFLILAVALLGWSLTRQLRKAQANKDAGVFGDDPVQPEQPEQPEQPAAEPDER